MAEDFGRISSFIWGTADLIRDSFRRGHYQDVILPMTVLRRIDCVLAPTHDKVLARHAQLKGEVDNHTMGLVFEDLIRRFNEALDENPGEHFTPRSTLPIDEIQFLDAPEFPRIVGHQGRAMP